MAKFRTIQFNLKDPKNPDLRNQIISGGIKPHKLVTMTTEEMASRDLQRFREKIYHSSKILNTTDAELDKLKYVGGMWLSPSEKRILNFKIFISNHN